MKFLNSLRIIQLCLIAKNACLQVIEVTNRFKSLEKQLT